MDEKGIKETKEMLEGMLELAAMLLTVFKDGAQATDIVQIFEIISKNDALKEKLLAAYNGAEHVQDEVKDVTLAEGIELLMIMIQKAPMLIEAAKK